jgi:hypothetical protein
MSWGGEITSSFKLCCAPNIARLKVASSKKVNVVAILITTCPSNARRQKKET